MKFTKKITGRHKLIGIFSLVIFLIILYLLISFFRVSHSELALAALEESFRKETICHEACYFWREAREKIVVDDLKNNTKKIEKRLIKYWQDKSVELAFKKELIKISFLVYGQDNPPKYVKDYLTERNANLALIQEIIFTYNLSPADSQNLSLVLKDKIMRGETSSEKIAALKILSTVSGGAEIDSYFAFLNSSESPEFKRELIKNISAIEDKSSYFTSQQLVLIKDLIFNKETNLHLRQDLVLVLSDYYKLFSEETELIWREIYGDITLDSISRLFSADFLNRLADAQLTLPIVSSSDWDNYYNK